MPASYTASGGFSKERTYPIGRVLEKLKNEFPDLTMSKIRFLDAEGLVQPSRSPKGYRRYSEEDIERLRYVLTMQRDHYSPLKVIREHLEAMDSGVVTSITAPTMHPDTLRSSRYNLVELAHHARLGAEKVTEMVSIGIIDPDDHGMYSSDDLRIVQTVSLLEQAGVDIRSLRRVRTMAARQFDVIRHAIDPITRSKDDDADQRAQEIARQISSLMMDLNAAFLSALLNEEA